MPQEERKGPRSPAEMFEQTLLTALAGLLNAAFGEKALFYSLSSFQATVMSNKHTFRVRRYPIIFKTNTTGNHVYQKY